MEETAAAKQIASVLGAYNRADVLSALKIEKVQRKAARERYLMDVDGWEMLPEGEPIPRPPTEWRELDGVRWIRRPENRPVESAMATASAEKKRPVLGVLNCPYCGDRTFRQDVCPNCAKGKAGIKQMYVCGENPDHVFFTE